MCPIYSRKLHLDVSNVLPRNPSWYRQYIPEKFFLFLSWKALHELLKSPAVSWKTAWKIIPLKGQVSCQCLDFVPFLITEFPSRTPSQLTHAIQWQYKDTPRRKQGKLKRQRMVMVEEMKSIFQSKDEDVEDWKWQTLTVATMRYYAQRNLI